MKFSSESSFGLPNCEVHFKEYVKDTVEDEISDVIIRCFDLCGKMNIDIERHIRLKMDYNAGRPHKHGKAY